MSYGSAKDILNFLDGSVSQWAAPFENDFSSDDENYSDDDGYKKTENYSDDGSPSFLGNDFNSPDLPNHVKSDVQKPILVDVQSENPNECSICLEENETGQFMELPCHHRFCLECVRTYLVLTINDNTVSLRHKMITLHREGEAISIRLNTRLGVVCPHHSCSRVIEQPQIQSIVDAHTYTKFDHNLFIQTLYQMKDITPCNFGCGGFLQEQCLCINPICKQKQLKLRKKEEIKRKRLAAMGENQFKVWARKTCVKCCPQCFNHIEKNGGCDHMYCTRCHKQFNWSSAPIFTLDAWKDEK